MGHRKQKTHHSLPEAYVDAPGGLCGRRGFVLDMNDCLIQQSGELTLPSQFSSSRNESSSTNRFPSQTKQRNAMILRKQQQDALARMKSAFQA
jgi:hypothetical protein